MKKGFISTQILLILEKEPCHGYKIGKAIEERTLGVWTPPASTLYTVLNYMHEHELIACTEDQEGKDAFFECMSFRGGTFSTQPWQEPGQKTITDPGDFLLVEAARRRDETKAEDASAGNEPDQDKQGSSQRDTPKSEPPD